MKKYFKEIFIASIVVLFTSSCKRLSTCKTDFISFEISFIKDSVRRDFGRFSYPDVSQVPPNAEPRYLIAKDTFHLADSVRFYEAMGFKCDTYIFMNKRICNLAHTGASSELYEYFGWSCSSSPCWFGCGDIREHIDCSEP